MWILGAQKQYCLYLPSLTSINSLVIPSEPFFTICVSSNHYDLFFCCTLADWVLSSLWIKPIQQLYCIQSMQKLHSPNSHLFLSTYVVSSLLKSSSIYPLSDSFPMHCSYFSVVFHLNFPLLIVHSYLHLCLSLSNTSLHQPGLVSSTQHQHPPPDSETDRQTEKEKLIWKFSIV